MKTITEMQQQIKEMSAKLDEFARDLLEYNKSSDGSKCVDYKQIKAIGSRNPIDGHVLKDSDDIVKKQYITLLIATIYTSSGKTDDAWLLTQRIATGAEFNEELADISVDAANITEEQIDEFTRGVITSELSQAFALDVMLIYISCGRNDEKMLEFMAALFELIKCSRDVIKELLTLATIIAEMDSNKYEEFSGISYLKSQISNLYETVREYYRECYLEDCDEDDMPSFHELVSIANKNGKPVTMTAFIPKKICIDIIKLNYYVKEFYHGIQYFTSNEIFYFSNKQQSVEFEFEDGIIISEANSSIIQIENAEFSTLIGINRLNKTKVVFKNCVFKKSTIPFHFNDCGYVEFYNCKFYDFTDRVAYVGASTFVVNNCSFANCGYSCNGDEYGGVFTIISPVQNISFSKNTFDSCYIRANSYRYNYGVTGCILDGNSKQIGEISIKECKFENCRCINNGNYTLELFSRIRSDKKTIENNSVHGEFQTLIQTLIR